MADSYKATIHQNIDTILSHLPKRASSDEKEFVRQYFRKMPLLELQRLEPEKACRMAQSSYEFIKERTLGEPKIRFFQPNLKEHGWESGTLVLEVLNDDMPFLVDSVSAELQQHNVSPLRIVHPIIHVTRNEKGKLKQMEIPGKSDEAALESFIHIHLPLLPEALSADGLKAELEGMLRAVRASVNDWQAMVAVCKRAEERLAESGSPLPHEEVQEAINFLEWLRSKNFVFLGTIDYDFYDENGNEVLQVVEGSELGLFKLDDMELKPQGLKGLPPEVQHFARVPHLIEITKSNRKSAVHRPVHMDYIGIKRFDGSGKVIGERRFLGLFTSIVYYQTTSEIPIIRRKIDKVLSRANFDQASHDGKALKNIMEFSPRDELFQMSEDDLFEYSIGVLSVEANPDVHLFVRRDIFERFISCMVFIPRDRFNTQLREQVQYILERHLGGGITAFYTQMTDSPLARAHIIIKTTPGKIPPFELDEIKREISKVTYQWTDMLREALQEKHGEAIGQELFISYRNAFPQSYINYYDISNAVYDIAKIRQVIKTGDLGLELFKSASFEKEYVHLKFYNPEEQAALSDILPMLENMGFRVLEENPFHIKPEGERLDAIWIRDFRLTINSDKEFDLKALKDKLEEVLLRVWNEEIENDGFNALTLYAGLDWRQVTLLRAYARYARQAQFPYSNRAMVHSLRNHPEITSALVELFQLRFDPQKHRPEQGEENPVEASLLQEIDWLLGSVQSLEEDRILRRFRDLITATWRTNFYQQDIYDQWKQYISFKINSGAVPELPLPRPYAEIFVYSMRVEGIHLRGGKVARGGLRWSDRREDYRTEVLGLMKAQMVKNAVIVPVGSKGGFVVKKPLSGASREAMMAEGVDCYKIYLRGLLDLTDNIVQGDIVPPKQVVRHDEDDPYLVVAADKGTATFSDHANSVSEEYGFWLGDAFASGGSVGYDHKAMGITARGAWVSVQRHFREMGVDTQSEDFTVIGIGDMGGDVFGNGMLLSEHIKLVGAFNHMHIFLDPNPDAAKSFIERKRLFEMPRSSWEDYSTSLISEGGGIFSRNDKSIKLSKEIRAVLDIHDEQLPPDLLIQAMLKAPVDLLWNGGIGTYVKAETENHEDVGDRANNALRVNGNQLRCKVVGEGGNLGFTQRGRIEYALTGGRMNTDAIDNSAGVDCSDHEVNIKIAFRKLLEESGLAIEKRNAILEDMTDEVALLVLRDNRLQTQAISAAEWQAPQLLEGHARMMQAFERRGFLNRAVEYLPTDKQLAERRQQRLGMTRPELSVLLSYAKMDIYQDLLESTFPDEAYLERDLMRYFPQRMREEFADAIKDHRLRREIIATSVTNSLVNRAGIAFFNQIKEDMGLQGCDVARAYTIARDAFEMPELWHDIENADGHIPSEAQYAMFAECTRFMERTTIWMLRNLPQPIRIEETIGIYKQGVQEYLAICDSLMTGTLHRAYEEKKQRFLDLGATEDLAHRIARMETVSSALDVVKVAQESELPIPLVGQIYFELGAELKLGWLRREASRMNVDGYWERLAAKAMINELFDQQRRLASTVLPKLCSEKDCSMAIDRWRDAHTKTLERYTTFIEDLKANETITFPMLVIALRNVESIGVI